MVQHKVVAALRRIDDNTRYRQEIRTMQHETPLGTLLRNRRQEARLSLSQLANLTGLHKSYLARIELGEVRQPSTENLQRIAAALELPEATVFGLLDER